MMETVTPPFQMLCQKAQNWCWAAVAAAVHQQPPTPLAQCKEAMLLLKRADCCTNPPACDVTASLSDALGPSLFQLIDGQISFNDLHAEIASHVPVCVRIVWDVDGDGIVDGAHFVVINGCEMRAGVEYVSVLDPDGGNLGAADRLCSSRDMPLDMFRSQYRLHGVWRQTYRITLKGG